MKDCKDIIKAVITVPAYFNDSQRQSTKDAGQIAGLDVIRIINEPTAAALAFGFEKKKSGLIVVFDLGGGTFDVSVLKIEDGVFEVKSTNGDTQLGGDDFDNLFATYIKEELMKQDFNIEDVNVSYKIKEAAEDAKITLSLASETTINLFNIPKKNSQETKHFTLKVGRAQLERLVEPLIRKTIEICTVAVKDAGINLKDIDEVLLVGGQTRMPAVRREVEKYFGKTLNTSINPDQSVAVGAAIQAAILTGQTEGMLLLDVTPFSLGIETLGGVAHKLIPKNTTIPTKKSQIYSTAADGQTTVTIKVCQGERELAKDNKILGVFDLEGIAPAPRGVPQIEVTFDIDANGIVNVSGKDKATNKQNQITIHSTSGLTEDEKERMRKDAEEHAEEDRMKVELINQRNEADNTIYSTEKQINNKDANLDDATKANLEDLVKGLKESMAGEDKEDMKSKTDALNSALMASYSNNNNKASGTESSTNQETETNNDNS